MPVVTVDRDNGHFLFSGVPVGGSERSAGYAKQHQRVVVIGGIDCAGRVFDAVVAVQDEAEIGGQGVAGTAVAAAIPACQRGRAGRQVDATTLALAVGEL
ncbi:hypothetical protein VX159_08520 [Dechloromonas sp. ZY10]|uniref:hypothetical protein n=1 Tax=Dechloromonas aquae TaxID=2664436 RepID=UPI0035276E5B